MRKRIEDKIVLAAERAKMKEEGSLRKTTALIRKTQAEKGLRTQKVQERSALLAHREARRARLLSESELRKAKLRPYVEVAKQIVGVPWKGLKALSAMSDEYARAHPQPVTRVTRPTAARKAPSKTLDIGIDLGKIELL